MELKSFDFTKKVALHPDHLVKLKNAKRPFPVTIEVDLTNHCNHRCSFCVWGEHIAVDKSTLETKTIKKCIKDLKNLGAKAITFTGGGEPMIHKDFYDILSFTKKNNLECGLITNGSPIIEKKCSVLIDSCKWIRFSISGGNKESYFAVQGKDHFDLVTENIKMLCSKKISKKSNTKIGLRMLITEKNFFTLTKLASLYRNIKGLNFIQIAPDHMSTDEGKFWNSHKVKNEIEKTEDILRTSDIELMGSSFELLSTSNKIKEELINIPKRCYAHFFQITVMADGNIAFCKNARFNDKYKIGNINNHSIKKIWNSQTNKDIEKWIKPNNCGLTCKVIRVNLGVESIINPDTSIDPNFIG